MDSDLHLIQIDGEDDSLLQQTPNATSNFSLSPLRIPKRNSSAASASIKDLKDNMVGGKPSCSFPRDSGNKENLNMSKTELPKLNLEPQQMKRRKKGGVYNLRKSLSWDRAFFTEEGFLNPSELSMLSGNLSGNLGNFAGQFLSVIHEEESEPLSCDSVCTRDMEGLKEIEEILIKEIPVTTPNDGRDNGGSLLPMHDSSALDNVASTPVATAKVPPNNGNRSGSKSRICPLPLASSSLKRPASVSAKAAMKEPKLPRIPVSKPGPCLLLSTAKSTMPHSSRLKHNQIAQSNYVLKNADVKGSSKNTKAAPNKAKASPACVSLSDKSSLHHSMKNKANLPLKMHSSTDPQLVSNTNVSLKVTPEPVLQLDGIQALDGSIRSRNAGVSLPQNTCSLGGIMQCTQLQKIKPSGLRMPSPSLGFFGQPKSSIPHSLSQKASQSCNLTKSCIPHLSKHGASIYMHELRTVHAPDRMPKVVHDTAAQRNVGETGSSMELSAPSAVNDVPEEKMALSFEANKMQSMVPKASSACESPEAVNHNQVHHTVKMDHKFQGCAATHEIEQISYDKDTGLQMDDKILISQMGSREQFKRENKDQEMMLVSYECKVSDGNDLENHGCSAQTSFAPLIIGVCGTKNTTGHRHLEDNDHSSSVKNQAVISDSGDANSITHIELDSLIKHSNFSCHTHEANELSEKQGYLMNLSVGNADKNFHLENHTIETNSSISFEDVKPFQKSHKNDHGSSPDVNSKIQVSSGRETGCSNRPSQQESSELANKAATAADDLAYKHVEDVKVQFHSIFSKERCKSNSNTLAVCNPYFIVECQQSREHPEPLSSCLVVKRECQSSYGSVSDDHLSAERVPSGGYCEVSAIESVADDNLERSDNGGSERKGSYVIVTQEPGVMQDGAVDADKKVEQPHVEVSFSCPVMMVPSSEKLEASIAVQSMDDIKLSGEVTLDFDLLLETNRHQNRNSVTSKYATFCSLSKELQPIDPSAQTSFNGSLENNIMVEEDETKISSHDSHVENHNAKANNFMLLEVSSSLEKTQTGDLKNTADLSPIDQISTGCELSSFSPSQLKEKIRANEGEAEVDEMTYKSNVGDAKMCPLDGNLLVERYDSCPGTSAVQSQYPIVVTGINKQFSEQAELQNLSTVEECVLRENHELNFNSYSSFKEGTSSEESREENILQNLKYVVPEGNDGCQSESENSNIVAQVSPAMQDADAEPERMDKSPHVEDASLGSLQIKTLAEKSLLVQTPTGTINILDVGVDGIMHVLPNEAKAKFSNIASPVSELHQKLDNLVCRTENEDAAKPLTRSKDIAKRNNLIIKPPINAVPFSEEWLAALEAAGEDILTMKGGAVQNSPPDKSVPELGPWSPVKRKSNQIGPFDCTKFTNIQPSNSH